MLYILNFPLPLLPFAFYFYVYLRKLTMFFLVRNERKLYDRWPGNLHLTVMEMIASLRLPASLVTTQVYLPDSCLLTRVLFKVRDVISPGSFIDVARIDMLLYTHLQTQNNFSYLKIAKLEKTGKKSKNWKPENFQFKFCLACS